MNKPVTLPSRQLVPATVETLKSLATGDRVKLTQRVRVGAKVWDAVATGTYRGLNYLSTGVTTERVKEDDLVVPTLHFTKDTGELASIALDEYTKVEKLS